MRRYALVSLMTLSLQALAIEAPPPSEVSSNSEFMHQADKGTWEITPKTGFLAQVRKYNAQNGTNNMSEKDIFTWNIQAKAEYGISEMVSVGVDVGAAYTKTRSSSYPGFGSIPDTYSRGPNDPNIFVNGRYDFGAGHGVLRYGGLLSFSLEDSRENADGNTNQFSGGYQLIPYVGYEMTLGEKFLHTFGARLSYPLLMGDRKIDVPGDVETLKHGEIFSGSLFYEFTLHPVKFGLSMTYENHAGTSVSTANGFSGDDHDSYNAYIFDFYVPYRVGSRITLLSDFSFGIDSNYDSYTYDSRAQIGANFGARFAF